MKLKLKKLHLLYGNIVEWKCAVSVNLHSNFHKIVNIVVNVNVNVNKCTFKCNYHHGDIERVKISLGKISIDSCLDEHILDEDILTFDIEKVQSTGKALTR